MPSTGSEHEEIEWDETTARRLHRRKEMALLQRANPAKRPDPSPPAEPGGMKEREP